MTNIEKCFIIAPIMVGYINTIRRGVEREKISKTIFILKDDKWIKSEASTAINYQEPNPIKKKEDETITSIRKDILTIIDNKLMKEHKESISESGINDSSVIFKENISNYFIKWINRLKIK
ncbi:MAG: hypothetical protein NTZ20_04320 [Candidatus Levybacteria bacterium]|nr:hypothetical protein [Candidatus Levybacteria bacterium]